MRGSRAERARRSCAEPLGGALGTQVAFGRKNGYTPLSYDRFLEASMPLFSKLDLARACLAAFIAVAAATSTSAQQQRDWQFLRYKESEDITGRRDTVTQYARELGAGAYILRTDYPSDRVTASGERWRSSYLTAQCDCGERTMRLIRTDYYSRDGTFVAVLDRRGITLTADMIAKGDDWVTVYNFACGIQKSP